MTTINGWCLIRFVGLSDMGLSPLFWKVLQTIPALELICHRIMWSFAFLIPFVLFLMGTALVTAPPLLLFTLGVQPLALSTMGFLQYIAPTSALPQGRRCGILCFPGGILQNIPVQWAEFYYSVYEEVLR